MGFPSMVRAGWSVGESCWASRGWSGSVGAFAFVARWRAVEALPAAEAARGAGVREARILLVLHDGVKLHTLPAKNARGRLTSDTDFVGFKQTFELVISMYSFVGLEVPQERRRPDGAGA